MTGGISVSCLTRKQLNTVTDNIVRDSQVFFYCLRYVLSVSICSVFILMLFLFLSINKNLGGLWGSSRGYSN